MDVTETEPRIAAKASLPAGIDHAVLENDGPTAHGDRMGTPAPDEKVLWKGRPALGLLARSAFHTRTLGLYFAALIIIALVTGSNNAAIVSAVLGTVLIGLLYFLAWLSARSTLYILTDVRLILRIGMAIETRINIPLKQVKAAHLRPRSDGHGDIALELGGERLLGTLLLWPHVRPWQYSRPQPMLRSVPDAASLAQLIAEARSQYGAIEQNLIEIKDVGSTSAHQRVETAAIQGRTVPVARRAGKRIGDQGLEGAPA
ncbi:MAG: photosynthetic complex assembly protein [Alphaproteobacteria bacterium HGW-Alphaproteobacteria-14]|nr:MAG: photosynthetic complex assembly protein [Alphaproteobacteria bacterium HGW-Alphaproteobacteria-14]